MIQTKQHSSESCTINTESRCEKSKYFIGLLSSENLNLKAAYVKSAIGFNENIIFTNSTAARTWHFNIFEAILEKHKLPLF
jgi:hypothetical protein